MSSATATPKSSDAPLQQETKQRKNLVSKILKRSNTVQTPTNDQKQQTNAATVTFNIKNDTSATEEADMRRNPLLQRELQVIAEDAEVLSMEDQAEDIKQRKAKRATMVKKAIHYFEDRSNRSMSEDNLYTRRKNLAVHLGVDETVSMKEVQKINTYCLPVPSSALPPEAQEAIASSARKFNKKDDGNNIHSDENTKEDSKNGQIRKNSGVNVVESIDEEEEDDCKTKNLAKYLGMKDGTSVSISSQGRLSDGIESNSVLDRRDSSSKSNEEKPKSLLFSKGRTSSLTSPTKRSTLAKLHNTCATESKRDP